MKNKDPKKVAAGRKGGMLSPTNFKNNRAAAVQAGKISAWKRQGLKLADLPTELLEGKK